MTDLEHRLAEDKALRDAALALFKADLALVRSDLEQRSVGGRIADRLGESAMDMLDEAVDYTLENRGKVAAGVAAVVLWFARRPILGALADFVGDDEEPGEAAGRSDEE